ncbi:hypothetical protein LJC68_10705, partial [Bacteroidales bacterium OttesenSCG-928-B11]|nr:hypothetical protein [Bacteroidales bacterium OttesenSCG-928-B11]
MLNMNSAILILTPSITPRISYTFNVIFGLILGIPHRFTTDEIEFENNDGVKFSYGGPMRNGIHFQSVSLLHEKNITTVELGEAYWNGLRLFFPVENSCLPFDPFAVAFYLISRYEEYLPDTPKDQHARFDISGAVAFQNGFHRQPVVNIIAYQIADILKNRYACFHYPEPRYRILCTYDVDMAYQYKGKSSLRFAYSLAKAVIHFDVKKMTGLIYERLGLKTDDEYDQFDNHRKNNELRNEKPIHFLLTAPFGEYDRNIDPDSKAFKELVEQLSQFSEIGIHPSYHTSEKQELLSQEKTKLEHIYGKKIVKSRQHYLRFSFPSTFDNLINNGITDDYSLGWTTEVGFRSSIATPYPFYDLSQEKETSLILHPLTVMDSALARLSKEKEEQIAIFN